LGSTGLYIFFDEPAYSPSHFLFLIGLGLNSSSQLGHVLYKMLLAQVLQKVHSKLQIIASVESKGSGCPQFSHIGLSSSIVKKSCH
jgi:hypothetical protein